MSILEKALQLQKVPLLAGIFSVIHGVFTKADITPIEAEYLDKAFQSLVPDTFRLGKNVEDGEIKNAILSIEDWTHATFDSVAKIKALTTVDEAEAG
jgi:ABC-type phosphate transport system permease subunit